jgi:DNA invertase Pin-like site-specific DNA recombinase
MSPTEQEDTIKAWCATNNAVVVSWHDETDSVSGKTTNRVGLKAAMTEALSGETDGLIVARVDRFARNLGEGLVAVKSLHDAGRQFIAVRDGIGGHNAGTQAGKLLLTMLLLFAEWQLETATDYWDATKRRHIGNGVATNYPWGYTKGTDRRLVPVPDEAREVVRIFELRAAGASWQAIADDLNGRGVPTPEAPLRKGANPGDPSGRVRAKLWVNAMLPSVVNRRTYLGELRSGGIENPTAHEPIVSLDLWERAHAMAKTPGKAGRDAWLLAGLVRCGTCGGRMSGLTNRNPAREGRRPSTYYYYKCRTQYSWGTCPRPARVPAFELEALVVAAFEDKFLGPLVGDVEVTPGPDLVAALDALRAAEADLRAFVTSPSTARMGDALGQSWVDEGIDARTAAVVAARDDLTAARAAAVGLALPAGLAETWPDLDDEERRTMLSAAFAVIAVRAAPLNHREPTAGRVRIWHKGEAGCPDDLPQRGGANNAITPINF